MEGKAGKQISLCIKILVQKHLNAGIETPEIQIIAAPQAGTERMTAELLHFWGRAICFP